MIISLTSLFKCSSSSRGRRFTSVVIEYFFLFQVCKMELPFNYCAGSIYWFRGHCDSICIICYLCFILIKPWVRGICALFYNQATHCLCALVCFVHSDVIRRTYDSPRHCKPEKEWERVLLCVTLCTVYKVKLTKHIYQLLTAFNTIQIVDQQQEYHRVYVILACTYLPHILYVINVLFLPSTTQDTVRPWNELRSTSIVTESWSSVVLVTPAVCLLISLSSDAFHCKSSLSSMSVPVQVNVTLPPDLAGFGSCVIFTVAAIK